jgi:Matrixin
MTRFRLLLVSCIVGAGVVTCPPSALADPLCIRTVPLDASAAQGLDLGGCDVVSLVVEDHGVAVAVPRAGEGVTVDAWGAAGSEQLTVLHEAGGRLRIQDAGSERSVVAADPLPDPGSGDPACFDDAYTRTDYRESDVHQWFINPSGRPGNITAAAAQSAMVNGANNIVNARSDCGDFGPGNSPTGAQHNFAGTTTNRPNISSSNQCTDRDGINTRGWGPGNSDFVAVNCSWYYLLTYEASEADHLYNTNFGWYTGGSSCLFAYDLESVSTHEWGHTFGLDHVSEDTHPTMTMSTNSSYCDTSARTLGRGDALGMYSIY